MTRPQRNLLIVLGVLACAVPLTGVVLLIREGVRFVPSHNYYAPVALQMTPDGEIEALYAPCDDPDWQQDQSPFRRKLITGFELMSREPTNDEEAPSDIAWQFDLDEPTALDSVVLGELPQDATEEVPWPDDGIDAYAHDTLFTARFIFEDGRKGAMSFRLDELDVETILFRDKNMPPEEFATAERCKD